MQFGIPSDSAILEITIKSPNQFIQVYRIDMCKVYGWASNINHHGLVKFYVWTILCTILSPTVWPRSTNMLRTMFNIIHFNFMITIWRIVDFATIVTCFIMGVGVIMRISMWGPRSMNRIDRR